MNAPGRVVAKRYSARAAVVADILRAAGVVPDLAVLRTLAVINQHNPTLMFNDFAAGCLLALTMDEASAAGGGHA
jgi:hypothetical protein